MTLTIKGIKIGRTQLNSLGPSPHHFGAESPCCGGGWFVFIQPKP